MSWLAWLGLLLVLLAVAAAGISAYGAKRWTDFMRALTRSLEAARLDDKARSASPARFDSRDLEGLPAPVQRYFRAVLKDGQPIVSALTIEMAGTFIMSAAAEQWKPFTSQQRVVTHRPGFLWEAKVSMLPGLVVRVLDSYIAGAGLLSICRQMACSSLLTTKCLCDPGTVDGIPILFHAQALVRLSGARSRCFSRRLRHSGRAHRNFDPGADPKTGAANPGDYLWHELLE